MNRGSWARLVFLVGPLLGGLATGCGNFWQAPTNTTPTPCTTCTTATSGNFYILNSGTSPQIVGQSIVSGVLTGLSGSPWTVSGTPYAMAMAPNGNFLIVSSTSGVFAFPITNGLLGTATVVTADQAFSVQVDQTSSWLLEGVPAMNGVTIGTVPISSTTGASMGTEQTATFSIANAAVQPSQLVVSGDNLRIFAALAGGGTIVVPFNASATSGTNPLGSKATTIPVINSSGAALSVAVDPGTSPRLFYIGETLANSNGTSGGLRAFTYSSLGTSTLVQATGSPMPSGGLAPKAILPITSGAFIYVANGQGANAAGNVTGFAITANGTSTITYTVGAGIATATGVQPVSLAEDSTSTFVLGVSSLGSPYFNAYTFDTTTTGQLDSQITSTTAAGSIAIVAAP